MSDKEVVPVRLYLWQIKVVRAMDEPVSEWIRKAVEQRLIREVPGYQGEEPENAG